MDPVSIGQLARELGGEVRGADAQVQGAVIDSRRTGEGDLFVALAGSRVDGHDYLAQAREAGAAAAMVERWLEDALPQWRVENARQTLARLGTLARERSRAKIVGITGSNGKTTVKEMIAAIAGRCGETLATQGNLNNELGVPLTLCRLDSSHRYAVVEMGCSRPGDIATLAGWTRPDIGLVTNAGPAHLEGLGDLDGVARTKGELFQELPADGVAVVNADDRYAEFWMELAGDRRRLTFGMADAGADVHGEAADGDRLLVRLPDGTRLEVTLPLPGAHNRLNALAAAAVGYALGAPAKAIREGLEALRP
ncbi:MAG: Mur ligase family protein, partial [Ectothiorhodospiraceae bacterium]